MGVKPPNYPLKLILPTKPHLSWAPPLGTATGPETLPTKIQHPTLPNLPSCWPLRGQVLTCPAAKYLYAHVWECPLISGQKRR